MTPFVGIQRGVGHNLSIAYFQLAVPEPQHRLSLSFPSHSFFPVISPLGETVPPPVLQYPSTSVRHPRPLPLLKMEDLLTSALRIRLEAAIGFGLGSLPARRDYSTVPDAESLGTAYLAPHAIAIFISALEMGIIVTCFTRFLVRSEKERTGIRFLVYFLTCVAVYVSFFLLCLAVLSLTREYLNLSLDATSIDNLTPCTMPCHLLISPWARTSRLQTGATFATWWKISVRDYGNWVGKFSCFP